MSADRGNRTGQRLLAVRPDPSLRPSERRRAEAAAAGSGPRPMIRARIYLGARGRERTRPSKPAAASGVVWFETYAAPLATTRPQASGVDAGSATGAGDSTSSRNEPLPPVLPTRKIGRTAVRLALFFGSMLLTILVLTGCEARPTSAHPAADPRQALSVTARD